MTKYSMQDLKELRGGTRVSLANVRKALEEAEGNRKKILQIIRIKGPESLSEQGGRFTGVGLIAAKITDTTAGQRGTLVEVNAEIGSVMETEKFINMAEVVLRTAAEPGASTAEELMETKTVDGAAEDIADAVATITDKKLDVANVRQVRDEAMDVYLHKSSQDLPPTVGMLVTTDKAGAGVAHDVAMHVAVYSLEYLSRDEAPTEVVERERETLTEATVAEGKPKAVVVKVVESKMNGFFKGDVLLDQFYAKDPETTVGEIVEASKGKVTGFAHLQADE